jgi:hypothetical protein
MMRQLVKEKTYSLCQQCLVKVPARVFIEGTDVIMEKNCPTHGITDSVVEKDPELYLNLCHRTVDESEISGADRCLIIPVEYRCNLDCIFCFLPKRSKPNISLSDAKKIVANFKGNRIVLSGGEPTLREDLCDFVRMVKDAGKECHLATGGLKLGDRSYVEKLIDAGLDKIVLSIYSTDKKIEKAICGQDVLDRKLEALKTISDIGGIRLLFSMTVVPGLNETEIKKILDLAIKNRVRFITIRSAARVGGYEQHDKNYFSQLLNCVGEQLNVQKNDFLASRQKRWTPYFIYVSAIAVNGHDRIYLHKKSPLSLLKVTQKYFGEVGILKGFAMLFKILKGEEVFHPIGIRIASWPDKYDIDFDEVRYAIYEHLYMGAENKDFFEALILNEGL